MVKVTGAADGSVILRHSYNCSTLLGQRKVEVRVNKLMHQEVHHVMLIYKMEPATKCHWIRKRIHENMMSATVQIEMFLSDLS